MEHQEGRCASCGHKRKLVVDHDHATGVVRGLICTPCNMAIGGLGDTPEGVRKALEYLLRKPLTDAMGEPIMFRERKYAKRR